jgi:hypothetical protein
MAAVSGATVPALMPEPSAAAMSGDPMSTIYALLSKQRNNDSLSAQAGVAHNRDLEKAQQAQQLVALQKQEEAQQQAAQWGLFGKIASVVAIVASAVASAFSCGAASGLCVAACIVSAAAFAEGETHLLANISPDAEKAFQVGCGITSAVLSCGAGVANIVSGAATTTLQLMGSGAQIASGACQVTQQSLSLVNDKTCQDVATAFGFAAAACALVGSLASIGTGVAKAGEGAASVAKQVVQASAEITTAVADIGAGGSEIAAAVYTSDATNRGADAKDAQLQIKRIQQLTDFLIDGLKESDGSHKRALQTLQGAMQTQSQTLVIASARV